MVEHFPGGATFYLFIYLFFFFFFFLGGGSGGGKSLFNLYNKTYITCDFSGGGGGGGGGGSGPHIPLWILAWVRNK